MIGRVEPSSSTDFESSRKLGRLPTRRGEKAREMPCPRELVDTSGIDAHAASSRVHDAVVPQLSVCPVLVGRDAELAALRTALVEAEQGRGGVVLLAGPAGIGKSRLLRELLAEARLHGDVAVAGRAVASASATPFRPLAQALLQAMRGGSFAEDVALHPWWSVLRQILPLPHVELGVADASMAGVDLLRQEAVLRLVRALAATAPLVIGLEDLQWADADTVGAVEYLADNLGDVRVLCLVTVRSEPRSRAYQLMHALVARRSIHAFSLDRLSRPEAAAMVRACRSDAAAEDVERVVGVADGVPFLIEELLAAPGVPETFAASVAARLAYLTPAEQRVVEVAALLGRQFPWRLLPDAAQEDLDIVGSALQRGVEHLVLSHDGDAYRFRHALTREAVLERLLPHVRAVLARHALAAVTAAYPGLPGSWRGVAAELAQQAGDRAWPSSCSWSRVGTRWAREPWRPLWTPCSEHVTWHPTGHCEGRSWNSSSRRSPWPVGRMNARQWEPSSSTPRHAVATAAAIRAGGDAPVAGPRRGRGHPLARRRPPPRLRRAPARRGKRLDVDPAIPGARR